MNKEELQVLIYNEIDLMFFFLLLFNCCTSQQTYVFYSQRERILLGALSLFVIGGRLGFIYWYIAQYIPLNMDCTWFKHNTRWSDLNWLVIVHCTTWPLWPNRKQNGRFEYGNISWKRSILISAYISQRDIVCPSEK